MEKMEMTIDSRAQQPLFAFAVGSAPSVDGMDGPLVSTYTPRNNWSYCVAYSINQYMWMKMWPDDQAEPGWRGYIIVAVPSSFLVSD